MKGCPYDNAVAEATFKIIKIEFVKVQVHETLEQLQYELAEDENNTFYNRQMKYCELFQNNKLYMD